jgi:uncharacterized protein YoxC
MNSVVIDILPYLIPALIAGAAGLIGYVHNLRTRVAILEKIIENLQKRMDSHSKKQDEILVKMNSMEHEVLKEVAVVNAGMAEVRSDLRSLSNLISFLDKGYRIQPAPDDGRK